MLQSVLMLVMGVLGILFYNLRKARPYIKNGTFSLAVFIIENKGRWMWSLIALIATFTMLQISPDINIIIKALTAFDLENTETGWAVYGIFLMGSVSSIKSKSNERPRRKRS